MTNLASTDGRAISLIPASVNFAWLEITPNCQLTCQHCYVASRPGLGHGKLSLSDWKHVIDALRSVGVRDVQFIGGEPTTHPHFCELLEYAADQALSIEVYSNLVSVTKRMWESFTRHNVSVATSFYSTDASIHDAITNLPGSYWKTLENIATVLTLGLRLRVGIIDIRDDQDIPSTEAYLKHLGVNPKCIGVDRVRGVGRGFNLSKEDAVSALCGKCVSGKCAITAEGIVYPCIMARTFPLGNVLHEELTDILNGDVFTSTQEVLNIAFGARNNSTIRYSPDDTPLASSPYCNPTNECIPITGCVPRICSPLSCQPACAPVCYPACSPHCTPSAPCRPGRP